MGATDEPDPDKHVTRHYRRIERTIAVSTTEVTVEQYRAFAPEYVPPSPYSTGPDCPAGGISWYQALRYCNWLSDRARVQRCYPDKIDRETKLDPDTLDRDGFRLPTEAEWEYFCRGGTDTARSFGDSRAFLNRYAWTRANSEEKLSPVAQRLPNPLGMYDTLGSLWEWCHEGPTGTSYYSPYPEGSMEHPAGDPFIGMPANKDDWRYVRGGAFDYSSAHARSAFRDVYSAPSGRYQVGFRVVRTLHPDKAPPRSTADD
jgi:formylglycine-generating enzyme required for sulfatase activity